ncbi:MAG: MiaB [Clostridia bacterium]|nr:MiaB [Clostridia bacterium]
MKISFCTLGCKVNQYESEVLKEQFEKNGYEIVDFSELCDIAVINSCAVTEESSRKSRQMMRRVRNNNPNAIIAVIGCLSQTDGNVKLNEADIIVGNKDKKRLPEYIDEFIRNKNKAVHIDTIKDYKSFEDMVLTKGKHTRAMVKIQDGCNNFCSYCVIPYARGPIRSKDIGKAVNEIEGLVKSGYKEVVLTGIHLDNYGKEHNNYDLCTLLKIIDNIEGLERIRLSSLEPTFINKDNIETIKGLKHLCPHYHLSLQSGCDNTLKSMNRHYTTAEFYESIRLLRSNIPEVAITTDIIVGFPGETEKDFEESAGFAEKIGFSKIHVFPFSPRKGTKAWDMINKVDNEEKARRSRFLIDISQKSEQAFLTGLKNKVINVLFEAEKDGIYSGFTPNYAKINVNVKRIKDNNIYENFENTIQAVLINEVFNGYCSGSIAKN